jgi:hypothetical protein
MRPRPHVVEIVVLFVLLFLSGCHLAKHAGGGGGGHPATTPAKNEYHGPGGGAPTSLHKADVTLDWFIPLSVLLIGISVSLYFFAPEEHTLSFSIGGGAGAVLGLSLMLKTLLWLIPWLALGGVALAIAILIYELYLKFHSDTASGVARKLDAMLAEPAGRGGE